MLRRVLFAALLLVACGRALPSAEPLGSGPMAEPEGSDEPTSDRTASHEGRPEPSARSASALPAVDAGPEAGPVDASLAVLVDAGSDADASANDALDLALAGEYFGTDVSTVRRPGEPDLVQRDPNARTRVEQPAKDRLAFVIVDSARGVPLTSLAATLAGSDATVTAGQAWFEGGSVEGGRGRFTGNRLILDVEIEVPDQGDGSASIEYHFDGLRR